MARATIRLPKPADCYNDAAQTIRHDFGERYGGWTEYDSRGGWVDGQGNTVVETVTVFETYGDIDGRALEDLADYVKALTDEESVMTTVDEGEASFN